MRKLCLFSVICDCVLLWRSLLGPCHGDSTRVCCMSVCVMHLPAEVTSFCPFSLPSLDLLGSSPCKTQIFQTCWSPSLTIFHVTYYPPSQLVIKLLIFMNKNWKSRLRSYYSADSSRHFRTRGWFLKLNQETTNWWLAINFCPVIGILPQIID